MKKLFLYFSLFLFAFKIQATAPKAKTVPATRVTYYSAKLNCLINPNNDSTIVSFEYGLSKFYGNTITLPDTFIGGNFFFDTLTINGLTPGKTYHFRVKAENDSGVSYGEDRTFTTGSNFAGSSVYHSITVSSEGIVYTWGYNYYGQLGDSTLTNKKTPIKVLKGDYNGTRYLGDNPNNPIIAVDAGSGHSLALAADGTVYAWGGNYASQLGNNSSTNQLTPIKVLMGAYPGTTYLGDDPSNPIITIATGNRHNMAIAANGILYTWGDNNAGQLGNYSTNIKSVPIKVPKGPNYTGGNYFGENKINPVIAVSGGESHSVYLTAEGIVYTCGGNGYGQLGWDTVYYSYRNYTSAVFKGSYKGQSLFGDSSENPIIAISSGSYHNTFIESTGLAYSIGRNYNGQLGINSNTNASIPVTVLKGAYPGNIYLGEKSSIPMISTSGGNYMSYFLGQNSTIYSMGENEVGALGNETQIDELFPTRVRKGFYQGKQYFGDNPLNPIVAISSTNLTGLAITLDGKVFSWGGNNYGQLGDSTIPYSVRPNCVMGELGIGHLYLIKEPLNPPTNTSTSKDVNKCVGDSTKLSASGIGSLSWYSADSGGVYLGIGTTYKIANLSSDTAFYVQDSTYTASKRTKIAVNVYAAPKALVGVSKTICKGDSIQIGTNAIMGNSYSWTSSPTGFISNNSDPIVKPTINTIYYLKETITVAGCFNTDSIAISVNPLPSVSVGLNNTFCENDTAIIGDIAVAGNSYSWTSNPIGFTDTLSLLKVSPKQTTMYYLLVTNISSGCKNLDSVKVTINPLPKAFVGLKNSVCDGDSLIIGGAAVSGNSYTWINSLNNFNSNLSNPTIMPKTDAMYYIYEKINTTSCYKIDSIYIKVNPLPLVNAGNDKTICFNDITSIGTKGVSGNSYIWNSNQLGFSDTNDIALVSPIKTTIYYLKETIKTTGCFNLDSVKITVNQLPDTSLFLNATTINAKQTGATYQWVDCKNNYAILTGETAQTYKATKNGDYAVIINLNGCVDTSSCITISSLGTPNILNNNISTIIYPNPNNGSFIIQTDANVKYNLVNELGQIIQLLDLNLNNHYIVNIEQLNPGIYFLVGTNSNVSQHYKIVVLK